LVTVRLLISKWDVFEVTERLLFRTAVYQNVALSEVCMHTILEIVTFTCEIVVQKNFRNCYVIIMWHTTLNRLRVKVSFNNKRKSISESYCVEGFISMVILKESTQSEVRTTLYLIINSTVGKYCSTAFFKWCHSENFFAHLEVETTLLGVSSSSSVDKTKTPY